MVSQRLIQLSSQKHRRFVLVALAFVLAGNMPAEAEDRLLLKRLRDFQAHADRGIGSVEARSDTCLLSSRRKSDQPWDLQFKTQGLPATVVPGDVLCFSFEARRVDAVEDSDFGLGTVYFARSEPWQAISKAEPSHTVVLSREWSTYHCCSRSDFRFEASEVYMTLHLATQKQTIEIRNPSIRHLGKKPESEWPVTKLHYGGSEPQATWRNEALARIERIRKSDLTLQVRDAKGEPLKDVEVQLEQVQHAFAFGTFTDAVLEIDGEDGQRYRSVMKQLFHRITLPRYWADWGTESKKGREDAARIAEWGQSAGFELKTHLLLYPSVIPERVKQLRKDPVAFRREVDKAVDLALEQTQSLPCVAWDALNEVRDDDIVRGTLGWDYYAELFQRANRAQPTVRWFINENDLIEASPNQASNIEEYVRTIDKIIAAKGPVEGIGFQGHFSNQLTSIPKVFEILNRFQRFNLPIEITELDIDVRDEETQGTTHVIS